MGTAEILRGRALKDTLLLSAAKILCGGCWQQRSFAIKHCKKMWVWALQGCIAMGTAEILRGWALQGSSAAGRCKNSLRLLLVTAGLLCGWALQGYSAAGHCRDTSWLGTTRIFYDWTLQDFEVAVGHSRDTLRLDVARVLSGWAEILGG